MPKMLSWAKKISGRSSPKKSGQQPEVDKDSSPEKRNDAEGRAMADNSSSVNNTKAEKSSTEKEHSSKERRRINSVFSRETPKKEHSSDDQPSPAKQQSPSKTPSPEKTLPSVKKTPSFVKRFASFRIPGLDRRSPEKSSRSKSRSPELETISKDGSPSTSVQNEPSSSCTEASEPVHIRDKNLCVHKVNETSSERVTENGSKHEQSLSYQEPLQNKPSEIGRLSNTDRSDIPDTHPQPEENSNTGHSKLGRRSVSEKLYGEVIKEFDKMRTTRSRVMSNEFGTVREEKESPRSETRKEDSPVNSNTKNSITSEFDPSLCHNTSTIGGVVPSSSNSSDDKRTERPCRRIDNVEDKCLANEKQSSISRCELEKKKLPGASENHKAKEMEGENERGFKVTSPSSAAEKAPPKPVCKPLSSSETPSLHVDKEKQTQPVKSSLLVTEGDTPQHTSNDTQNTDELTPKAKFFSSIVTELSSNPVSNSSSVSVTPSPSGEELVLRPNESVVFESELSKKILTSENTVETLSPSAGASDETEEVMPSLKKSDSSTCVNDTDNAPVDTQVSETATKEVIEDSPSPIISQTSDDSESSPPEIKYIENNNNPVPSIRLSKLPKLSPETTHSPLDMSTISSKPSPVNHLPDLSEDCNSPSSNEKDGLKDPSLKEPVITDKSLPVHISFTNRQEQDHALHESSENTDSVDMSHLTEGTDDESVNKDVSIEELEASSKTENVIEDAEKLEQDSPSLSDKPSAINSEASVYSHVHTDPEVSVVSCYSLDEALDASKSTPSRTDTCDSTDGSLSPNSLKDESSERSSKSKIVSPTTPQRSLHEKMNRSSEEVSSPPMFTLRPKENGTRPNKEIAKTYIESGEYPSSGEGGSLPASPSVPRRRKKSHPVPVARSLQTLSPTSSGNLTPQEMPSNRERSHSQSKAPPRPPMPTSLYSPTHLSSSARLSSTLSPKTSSPENGSVSSRETRKHSLGTPVPQVKKTEPYNPFDSDEDTETSHGKMSLNPFDSDGDEDKRENNNNQALDKKTQPPPASYNPFDEDDAEDENAKDISSLALNSTLKSLDDSIASLRSQSSLSTHENTSKNPFDDDEDEEGDVSYNGTPLHRQSIGRQSFAVRSSSPFQREGVRASLPSSGRGQPAKKKRQAPLPPGYRPSPATTPLPPRNTMMLHGESSTSLYDGGSLRKNSMTSVSSLSLSPKRTPPPRPPPPKGKSVSLAQL